MKGYINSYDGLETWFRRIGSNRWNLYRGHVDKVSDNRSTIIYKLDSNEVDLEESWRLLREMLEINSGAGGNFTVYVPGKAQNHGFSSFFTAPNTLPARSAGIAGFEGNAAYGLMQQSDVDKLLAREKKVWELERRLEDMEAASGAQLSGFDRVVNNLLEDGTLGAVIQQIAGYGLGILAAKLGVGAAAPAAVSMSGFNQDDTFDASEHLEKVAAYEEEKEDYAIDLIDRFRTHFQSEQELRSFLEKVAAFFEKNPELAKNFFNGQ